MYGAVGAMGPGGPSYHPNPGEYGLVWFAIPAAAAVGKAVAAGLLWGTAAALTVQVGGKVLSERERAKHTGGNITLSTGEVVSSDEAHARLCAAAAPNSDLHRRDPTTGQSFCDMNPSQTADYWADLPQGIAENVKEMWQGYEVHKVNSGDCEPTAEGYVDPRCAGMDMRKSPIPTWAVFALVGTIAATIVLLPKKGA
jgi:hypothetical protein